MSQDLIARCQGRWRSILPLFGIPASALTGKHGPCPICGGKDRFRFDDRKPSGSGSWFCNDCRSGYGIHLVMKANGWSFKEAADAIEDVVADRSTGAPDEAPAPPDPAKVLERGKTIWLAGQKIGDQSATGRYLANRGIADVADVKWLRHGDRVSYLDEDGLFYGMLPAMLAVVQVPSGGIAGLHRTYLTPEGRKADVPACRKLIGTLPDGAAVRLALHGATLGIAEGIETALSATAIFRVPCWSAITSAGLEKWSPPDGVTNVVVFGDNDPKFGGQKSAFALAHRLACQGRTVRVEIPDTAGDDWNDVLVKRGSA